MKRCPKCSRTFPDDNQKFCTIDGGLLVAPEAAFDPNATISGSANLTVPTAAPPDKPASNRPQDFGETIAGSAPTAVLPRNKQTGPTGAPTSANMPTPPPQPTPAAQPPVAQAPSAPLPQAPATQAAVAAAAAPKKKSKLPLILGILAILLILGVGAVVAAFFLVIKPELDKRNGEGPIVVRPTENQNVNTNTNSNNETTPEPEKTVAEFVPPPDTSRFENSSAKLDGKLAEHYFSFSFYYPNAWQPDSKAGTSGASNFAKVERRLPPDFTQENFAVGWYTSQGTYEADKATFPQLVEVLGKSLADNFPEYHKVSEGPTKINSMDGYEFRFTSISKGSEKGDIHVWGRVVFLPSGVAGSSSNGATLVMLATSLAPELSGVEDVGEKGQMPVILESFRFGNGH